MNPTFQAKKRKKVYKHWIWIPRTFGYTVSISSFIEAALEASLFQREAPRGILEISWFWDGLCQLPALMVRTTGRLPIVNLEGAHRLIAHRRKKCGLELLTTNRQNVGSASCKRRLPIFGLYGIAGAKRGGRREKAC